MAECCLFAIGGIRPSRESGERRAPASPQGVARFFCCAVGRFLEGRAQCSDEAFGTSGVPLVCRIGGVRPSREGGERRSPASPQGGGEVLLLRGWAFLLRVAHSVPMERLGRAGRCLFAESEVRDRCSRAGSVAPLHPLKRQRDSFAARLNVSIEGRACWFAFDELDVACLQNRRCVTIARGRGASLPCTPSRGGEVLLLRGWAFLLRVGRVGSLMTSWMLLVCGIGGARLSREGGERRSPAPPQGAAGFFCCAAEPFVWEGV